ncbi:MAG: uncharacterized protein KVP18_002312 [Porospora cf. gigantea A]|nr:MAG: hypothetical protein KVP18_002312 [Porospora cf. gigantea A]
MDGTLCTSRQPVPDEMKALLRRLSNEGVGVAVVTGSDIAKVQEQFGDGWDTILDVVFAENGTQVFSAGELLASMDITQHMGEESTQRLINHALKYMADLTLPRKRGTFVEFRRGMINLCPVGRSIDQQGRHDFVVVDEKENIRDKMIETLQAKFGKEGWTIAKGGQISLDCYPDQWDKRFCLNYISTAKYSAPEEIISCDSIDFFGDRTTAGGNDYELFSDSRVKGHAVATWVDTVQLCTQMYL